MQKTSWRTTLMGWLGAFLLIGGKIYHHQPIEFQDIITAGSLIGIGTLSRDHASGGVQ